MEMSSITHLKDTWAVTEKSHEICHLDRFMETKDLSDFEVFFQVYQPRMILFARRFLRNHEDAEDVVQTAMIELMHKTQRQDRIISPCGWTLSFIRKACLMKMREESRRARREKNFGKKFWANKTRSNHSDENDRETLAVLTNIVQSLPPKYREPILSCYYYGFTPKQTATATGQPEGTVRSRLLRSKSKVKMLVMRQGFKPNPEQCTEN